MKSDRDPEARHNPETGEVAFSSEQLLGLMRLVLKRELPFRFKAKGRSMAPFIQDGDVITITSIKRRVPGLGDIVAYTSPREESVVVHRVAGRRGEDFLLIGDNMAGHADGWIPTEAFLGRVTRVERDGELVRYGLGIERVLIALLSRLRLIPILMRARAFWIRVLSKS